MKYQLDSFNRNTPDAELISDLKKVAKQLGKSPTIDEYNERGSFHATTLTRRFGGWLKALKTANLKNTRTPMNIPEEKLFENLEEVWEKLGRQPRYTDIEKPFSKYSAGTYEHRFGSWRKSLESFVSFMNENGDEAHSNDLIQKTTKVSTRHKTKRAINWRLRFIVMRRDNFKCKSCGRSPATSPDIVLHVDHIRAWANGGETVQENLQTLCSKCNIGKSNL